MVMWEVDRFKRNGRESGRSKLFLGQSIGIDDNYTVLLKCLF